MIFLQFQNYVTMTIVLFNDNIALIQMFWNVFTTRIYITICESLTYYSISKQTDDMTQPYTTILTGSDVYSPMTWDWKHMGTWLLEIQK